jgi:hypothetical protein
MRSPAIDFYFSDVVNSLADGTNKLRKKRIEPRLKRTLHSQFVVVFVP